MEHAFDTLAEIIIKNVGGSENIEHITHCATRLRLRFVDPGKIQEDAIRAAEGVLMIRYSAGEFQIVIGTKVPYLYQAVLKLIEKEEL